MFENFPTAEKIKPTQEVVRADFESKEKAKIKEGTDFLENMEPEKFKKKAANLLLAFSLFAGASTAFAGEQKVDKDLPSMGEEEYSQIRDKGASKNQIADFDWGKIAIKISTTNEDVKKFNAESVGYNAIPSSEFYKGTTSQERNNALSYINSSISSSQNYGDFLNKLSVANSGFSEKQKTIMLQQTGRLFGETYNYDMLRNNEHVKISGDDMLQALKDRLAGKTAVSGTCGNISNAQMEIAKGVGIEHSWLQTGSTKWGGQHVWTGMVLGSGAERTIAFSNYADLVLTKTGNYEEAMGAMERYNESVSIFNNYASNGDWVLQPVESAAQKVLKRATGIEESSDMLKRNLERGEIEKNERGIEVSISPETKEFEINTGTIGLTVTNFRNVSNDPYQSLNEVTSVGGSASLESERFGAKVGATVLHTDINAFSGESVIMNTIVGVLEADYIDEKKLTKGDFGELVGRVGANITAALSQQLGSTEGSKGSYLEGKGDVATGGTLIYINPDKSNEIYFGATVGGIAQTNNLEEQDLVLKKVAENFVVGANVKVFDGKVLNMEMEKGNLDWGKSSSLKAGIGGEMLKGNVSYEKKTSDHEIIIPSSEKIEAGVSYKVGPKMKVSFFVAKTTKKYQDGQSNDVYNAEVKLKMFLW